MSPRDNSKNRGSRAGFDPRMWRKLLGYSLRSPRALAMLCLFGGLTAAGDVAFPLVTRSLIDDLDRNGAAVDLRPYVALYVGIAIVLPVCVLFFIRAGGRVRAGVSMHIRREAFENLQRLSFSFYDLKPVGWLMARMTSDCERLSHILAWGVLDLVWGFTIMSSVAVAMLVMDLQLGLLVLSVVPVLAALSYVFKRRILSSARVVRKTNSRVTAAYNENITGARTSKVFGRERENQADFELESGGMYVASVRNHLQSALFLPLVMVLGSLATGVALAAGGGSVWTGALSLGTLLAFITYTTYFFQPVQELAHWLVEMQMAQASAERVLGLIEAEPDVQDSPEVRERIARTNADEAPEGTAPDGLPDRVGEIEFRDVDFHYEEGVPVLQDFSLKVEEGETVALVGSTGGGKSTVVSLLSRFYEPCSGELRWGGTDYRERSLDWLQSQLGIVLQTPHLFSGSVADNIRYGCLEASDEEVEEVARTLGAHDVFTALEDGYETEVGQGGELLSVGQRQLVSFARALLADPQVLVMDEATSSIDTETEARIQSALSKVLEGRTSFVIAHRLSTVRSADRILVIEDGRIVESGSHSELMSRDGRYAELYRGQSLERGAADDAWQSRSA